MNKNYIFFTVLIFLIGSCATYKPQFQNEKVATNYPINKKIEKTFYLIGDAGGAKKESSTPALLGFTKVLDTASGNSYAIFLGDNIYPKGMPNEKSTQRSLAAHKLDVQIATLKNYQGEVVFIPGNHDWYDDGLKGLKRQSKYLEEKLDRKDVLLPEKGCGLTDIDVSDHIQLIILDSQWYLENWNNHPGINDNCSEIKSRKKLFEEIKGLIKKNQNKTIVFALHHPLMTHGPHGGAFAAEKHLFPFQSKIPLPGLASVITHIRKSGGISIQDRINERYNELAKNLLTLARDSDRIIFTSGHEHSLQYNKQGNTPQIVSGSGSKNSATKLTGDAVFTYGGQGFAVLDVFTDGSSWVRYYASDATGNNTLLFETEIHKALEKKTPNNLPTAFPTTVKASIYENERTYKSNSYKRFWGDHYRDLYGLEVTAPVALLDTLYGGLTPIRKGGGNQTKSLRLVDKEGREFNMRALKKSALQFLQSKGLGVASENDFDNTLPEDLLLDFYTAAHPYAPFAIADMADAIGVYHTNPKLYYVPKQQALGAYNSNYGDELYMIEERPMEAFENLDSFGAPKDLESMDDLYKKLRKDEKYTVDERSYIRARLFDMLLGDWDRHADQWRWSEFEDKNGNRIFKPIPRDRDQVFSKFDGFFLNTIRSFMSSANLIQVYDGQLNKLQWFNFEPLPLDRTLLENMGKEDWIAEAKHIQSQLTDAIIEEAFMKMPKEVQDETMQDIIVKLKQRRGNLEDIATRYHKVLHGLSVLTGTDKDDYILVERIGKGLTRVRMYRIKDGKKADLMIDKTFDKKESGEIWIYGLDDDDIFEVTGKAQDPILIRLIGGQNNDIYKIKSGRKIHVYDYKTKKNTVEEKGGADFHFTDLYAVNVFDYKKDKYKASTILPGIGFNPDDGIKIGMQYTATKYGFERNPFSNKHSFAANYYFATSGFEFLYNGESANIFNAINLTFGAKFTSENFARNFFGFGSDSPNFDDDLEFDFNRVKLSEWMGYVGFIRRSNYGSDFTGTFKFQGIQVDNTSDRFINAFSGIDGFFDRKFFGTAALGYTFESYDVKINPSRGLKFDLETGYTLNIEDTDRGFAFLKSGITFFNRITSDEKLVLKTSASTQINFNDDIEFYQAANLGGNTGLRGFRNERFSGSSSLVFNGDLRYRFEKFKTTILPLQFSVYGGYDYGRVWAENDPNNAWQQSFGGGVIINSSNVINGDFALFSSDDGLRFTLGFGLAF
ncbi:metallophosphoesterase [Ascidiimonas sp. W6]|uniref:metallophosphoesterase n=1 Tax=Ascidiimonas meishanensis TaxID=3128903 RepID=UPI0030EBA0E7